MILNSKITSNRLAKNYKKYPRLQNIFIIFEHKISSKDNAKIYSHCLRSSSGSSSLFSKILSMNIFITIIGHISIVWMNLHE